MVVGTQLILVARSYLDMAEYWAAMVPAISAWSMSGYTAGYCGKYTGSAVGVVRTHPPSMAIVVEPARLPRTSIVTRPATARFLRSAIGLGPGVAERGGMFIPSSLPVQQAAPQMGWAVCAKDDGGVTRQASVPVTVDVVPSHEQPDLVLRQAVVYNAQAEPVTRLRHCTTQLETVMVALQVEAEFVGDVVRDDEDSDGFDVGWSLSWAGSSFGGPSIDGPDEQPSTETPRG